VNDFAGPWPEFENVPGDTVVLHIQGVETPAQHDAIIYTRLEQIAPTKTATGFVAGERRGEKWQAPRLTVTVAPVRDAEAFARKIDFGRVVAVKGNVISVAMRAEGGMPERVRRAIANTKSDDIRTLVAGVEVLEQDFPENRRPEVQRAFERILDVDPDPWYIRDRVMDPYCKFATRDDMPTLLRYLAREKGGGLNQMFILGALARLKDVRGVGPIAERGVAPATRGDAKAALVAYGPVAEGGVHKLLGHQDAEVRAACEVLGKIGTVKSLRSLSRAAQDPAPQVGDAAAKAMAEIKKRK
jgi:hypothetical protein